MTGDSQRREQWFYLGPWAFSIDLALAQIAARSRAHEPLDVTAWATAYGLTRIDDPDPHTINLIGPTSAGLNRDHAMTADLTQPVIVAQLDIVGQPTPLLIDGVHRLYRAWRDHKTRLPAYLLTVAETRQIRYDLMLLPGGASPRRRMHRRRPPT